MGVWSCRGPLDLCDFWVEFQISRSLNAYKMRLAGSSWLFLTHFASIQNIWPVFQSLNKKACNQNKNGLLDPPNVEIRRII